MADPVGFLLQLAVQYGYFGIFLASLAGSLIPFLPVPYLFVAILLSGTLDPLALGIVAGIGGALGKTTSYFLGKSGYLLSGMETRKNLEFFGSFIRRYGTLGVFVFAISPLPDDIYFVPLGMVKFPFWRFMAASAAGKAILSTAVAYFGRAYFQFSDLYLGVGGVTGTVVIIMITLAVTILLARTDWELAYRRYQTGGVGGVLRGAREILHLKKEAPAAS